MIRLDFILNTRWQFSSHPTKEWNEKNHHSYQFQRISFCFLHSCVWTSTAQKFICNVLTLSITIFQMDFFTSYIFTISFLCHLMIVFVPHEKKWLWSRSIRLSAMFSIGFPLIVAHGQNPLACCYKILIFFIDLNKYSGRTRKQNDSKRNKKLYSLVTLLFPDCRYQYTGTINVTF